MTDQEGPHELSRQVEALQNAIKGAVLTDADREALKQIRPHAANLARLAQVYVAAQFFLMAAKYAVGIAGSAVVLYRFFWNGQ
jgi:GTP cyclohydrolase FolE2